MDILFHSHLILNFWLAICWTVGPNSRATWCLFAENKPNLLTSQGPDLLFFTCTSEQLLTALLSKTLDIMLYESNVSLIWENTSWLCPRQTLEHQSYYTLISFKDCVQTLPSSYPIYNNILHHSQKIKVILYLIWYCVYTPSMHTHAYLQLSGVSLKGVLIWYRKRGLGKIFVHRCFRTHHKFVCNVRENVQKFPMR